MAENKFKRVVIEATGAKVTVATVKDGMKVIDEPALDRNRRPLPPTYPEKSGEPVLKAYPDWSKKDLEEEIARRNEGRDEADLIVADPPGNKAELADALAVDDAAHA